jgi:hypothetical protein
MPAKDDTRAQRMVALLIDGLRCTRGDHSG